MIDSARTESRIRLIENTGKNIGDLFAKDTDFKKVERRAILKTISWLRARVDSLTGTIDELERIAHSE